jgi:homeobox-leucine zipper protein
MSSGGAVQSIANLAKGQDRGNAVTIQVSAQCLKQNTLNKMQVTFKAYSSE